MSHVIQTFSRRPLMSYTLMVLALVATGFLSFGLWVHHMYTVGLSPAALGLFAAVGAIVAIPSGINVFGWIATIWAGKPVWRTPFLFSLAAIIIFTIGGVSGVMVAAVPFDFQAHDTYFIVAHLHYVLFGGTIFPIFAALYFWVPKFSGKMLSEKLGLTSAAIMFIGFNVAFGPMHLSGLEGMPRRVYTYPSGLGLEGYNLLSTIGAFMFAAGVMLSVTNFIVSLKKGKPAGNDPWQGDTLEWSESSPPENAQFRNIPVVRSRHPMWDQTTLEPVEDDAPDVVRAARALQAKPERWRGSLIVGVMDGRPIALAHLPRSSISPFVVSIGFLLLFTAALLDHTKIAFGGAVVTAIGLIGWFWPIDTEAVAIRERGPGTSAMERTDDGDLELAVGTRQANGYWGTGVLLVILATALATLLSGYFYLGTGASPVPPGYERPSLGSAVPATVTAIVILLLTRWLTRAVDRREDGTRRTAAVVTMLVHFAFAALAVDAWQTTQLDPGTSAYGSSILGLIGYAILIAVSAGCMMMVTSLWAFRSPGDPRGRGVALNSSLVSYYSAINWLLVAAAVYLWPRLT